MLVPSPGATVLSGPVESPQGYRVPVRSVEYGKGREQTGL